MTTFKPIESRIIERVLLMASGYVLNFSDRTFAEFFEAEIGIEIDQDTYREFGTSKANRLRTFFKKSDDHLSAKTLRALWPYVEETGHEVTDSDRTKYFEVVAKLEGAAVPPRTDGMDAFVRDETLEELIASIERDVQAGRPQASLDRLHTYCAKKVGHLLQTRGIAYEWDEPLNSRVGKYSKALKAEGKYHDLTLNIIRNSIGLFDQFNHVRNNHSLAHDNTLLQNAEARYVFDAIMNLLRFVKAIEKTAFGA